MGRGGDRVHRARRGHHRRIRRSEEAVACRGHLRGFRWGADDRRIRRARVRDAIRPQSIGARDSLAMDVGTGAAVQPGLAFRDGQRAAAAGRSASRSSTSIAWRTCLPRTAWSARSMTAPAPTSSRSTRRTGKVEGIGWLDGHFVSDQNVVRGWLTGWAVARRVAIRLTTGEVLQMPASAGAVSSVSVAGGRLAAVMLGRRSLHRAGVSAAAGHAQTPETMRAQRPVLSAVTESSFTGWHPDLADLLFRSRPELL